MIKKIRANIKRYVKRFEVLIIFKRLKSTVICTPFDTSKKIIFYVLANKTINYITRPILKRFKFFGERFALLPAHGIISVELPDSLKFCMVNNNGKDGVANYIYWRGVEHYEYPSTKVWMALTMESEVVFDIGAYTGLYSLLAACLNSKTQIFAFEPIDETYDLLKQNIAINNFRNIVPLKNVVSNTNGEVKLYIPQSTLLTGSASIINKFENKNVKELVVSSTSIDSFVRQRDILRVDLVKIDVETAELAVLEGMQRTIENYHPTILMEVLPHRRGMEEIYEHFFTSRGYVWFWLSKNGLVRQEHIRGNPTYKFSNYLFVKNRPLIDSICSGNRLNLTSDK